MSVEFASGVAVKVTCVPDTKSAEHVEPHAMPAGDDDTDPLPAPDFPTDSAYSTGSNVAMTDCAALIVTTHRPTPEHAPDQPANDDPASGVAVNVTCVPDAKSAEHVEPQSIPAGDELTDPLPPPNFPTESV